MKGKELHKLHHTLYDALTIIMNFLKAALFVLAFKFFGIEYALGLLIFFILNEASSIYLMLNENKINRAAFRGRDFYE